MRKILSLLIVASATLLIFATAYSQPGMPDTDPGKARGAGIFNALDLSADQKAIISEKEKQLEIDLQSYKAAVKDIRGDINKELSMENPDKAKINKSIENISGYMMESQKRRMAFMLWLRDQLSPEQKQKLQTLMQNARPAGPGNPDAGYPQE